MNENQEMKLKIPGRICLFGDKIDLQGLPVIAATITKTLTLQIKPRSDNTVSIYSENYKSGLEYQLGEEGDLNHPLKYWCTIIKRLKDRIKGFEAKIQSDIPIGAGLSSSAAISVALVKGLNTIFNLKMNPLEIAELAYQGEHDDLGIMCGRMDQYSIAMGGVSFIETGERPKVESLAIKSLPVVVGDSQEERHAKVVLNRIKQQLLEKDPTTHHAFSQIHRCVIEGKQALLSEDFQKIGQLMDHQQEQENKLGAATDKLNKLCRAAKSAGALGAKQMGAGGGGCMLAICPGKQQDVAKAIENAGGKPWIFDIFNYS
jgi:mevalonate kinase